MKVRTLQTEEVKMTDKWARTCTGQSIRVPSLVVTNSTNYGTVGVYSPRWNPDNDELFNMSIPPCHVMLRENMGKSVNRQCNILPEVDWYGLTSFLASVRDWVTNRVSRIRHWLNKGRPENGSRTYRAARHDLIKTFIVEFF